MASLKRNNTLTWNLLRNTWVSEGYHVRKGKGSGAFFSKWRCWLISCTCVLLVCFASQLFHLLGWTSSSSSWLRRCCLFALVVVVVVVLLYLLFLEVLLVLLVLFRLFLSCFGSSSARVCTHIHKHTHTYAHTHTHTHAHAHARTHARTRMHTHA